MRIIIWMSVALLFFNCTHKNFSSRAPNSSDEIVNEISDELLQTMQPIGDRKIFKFSVLKDATGKFSRLVVQNPRFQFHHEFLATQAEFKGLSQKEIEDLTYKNSKERRAYIGVFSIEYFWFADMDRPSNTGFYMMSEELPPVEFLAEVGKMLDQVRGADMRDKQPFIPLPHQEIQAQIQKELFDKLNLDILTEQRSRQMSYSDGWGIGTLVVLKTQAKLDIALKNNSLKNDTIVVAGEAFRELPPCAGVISAVALTPGSHLSLLAQMYGMPVVYEENAIQKYSASLNKTVFLGSSLDQPNQFQFFDKITAKEIETLRLAKQKSPLKFDHQPNVQSIIDVTQISPNQVGAYGGKATKLGLIKKAIPQSTVAIAAGLPVYYYHQFIKLAVFNGSSLQTYIFQELSKLNNESNYNEVTMISENIRKAFKQSSIDQNFISNIKMQLMTALNVKSDAMQATEVRFKLRSSSNVEDGAEFNGAGLYESEGVCVLNCKKDDFEKGLKKVWGSLYTARGLWARRQFQVDEQKVGMAMAVHAPFKGELFNGVVRFGVKKVSNGSTTETFKFSETTAQKGEEETVTGANSAGTAEVSEFIDGALTIRTPYKGFPKDRTLMRGEHYKTLFELMEQITKTWPEKKEDLEVESEWKVLKIGNSEKLIIKQIREVPKQTKLTFADKSNRIWITGDTIEFKGASEEIYDGIKALYRIRDFKLQISAFTENEIKSGKLKIAGAIATIKDKSIQLKAGKPKTVFNEGSWLINIPFSGDMVKNMSLSIVVPLLSQTVTSPQSLMEFTYEMILPSVKNASYREKLVPSSIYMDKFASVDSTAVNIQVHPAEKSCPIKVTGVRTLKVDNYDRRRMYFKNLKIDGILPKKSIMVSKTSDSFHQIYVHDGREVFAVDLFADPDLTPADKNTISKLGQYLDIQLIYNELGKKNEFTTIYDDREFSGRYKFTQSNFKLGKNPKGCEVFEDFFAEEE